MYLIVHGSVDVCSFLFCLFLIQIAAISPADINYDETLSTLRYGEFFMCVTCLLFNLKYNLLTDSFAILLNHSFWEINDSPFCLEVFWHLVFFQTQALFVKSFQKRMSSDQW